MRGGGRDCLILELLYLTFFKWIIKEIVPSYHRFEKHALVGKQMSYNSYKGSINKCVYISNSRREGLTLLRLNCQTLIHRY